MSDEAAGHAQGWRERRRQLQEQRPSFFSQAVRLHEERGERLARAPQLQVVCNRSRYLHREPKSGRRAHTPLSVRRRGMWPVERGIDLRAIEHA